MTLLTKGKDKTADSSLKKNKVPKKSSTPPKSQAVPALPQVNLLPTEITEKRNLSELKIKLAVYILVLVAVLGGGYGYVHIEKGMAQNRLEKAQSETIRLKTEEASYAEVPLILSQLNDVREALRDGMYREILWNNYLGALAGTVPDGGLIENIDVQAATLNAAGPESADGLQNGSIGTLEFTVNLTAFPDTAEWIDQLEAIPGMSDARLSAVSYAAPTSDGATYQVSGSVRLSEDAYSGRFEPSIDDESGDQ